MELLGEKPDRGCWGGVVIGRGWGQGSDPGGGGLGLFGKLSEGESRRRGG